MIARGTSAAVRRSRKRRTHAAILLSIGARGRARGRARRLYWLGRRDPGDRAGARLGLGCAARIPVLVQRGPARDSAVSVEAECRVRRYTGVGQWPVAGRDRRWAVARR